MQNNTAFAGDIRMGVDALLNAMSSTDSTRRAFLAVAKHQLDHAEQMADTPEEHYLVNTLREDVFPPMMEMAAG